MKFLLTEGQAREVERVVGGKLAIDTHADPALGGAYLTTSLYTDTPDFDVLRRSAALGGCKYRVRRYGAAGPVFLEKKSRQGNRVQKWRSPVPVAELAALAGPERPGEWPGRWFHGHVLDHSLMPVCRIAYERVAYTGTAEGGTVRLTFDRRVRGEAEEGWAVAPVGDGPELLPERVICEFKFRHALPSLFKSVIADLGLAPGSVSKYRLFMASAGIGPAAGAGDA